jgi:hypothetical protein
VAVLRGRLGGDRAGDAGGGSVINPQFAFAVHVIEAALFALALIGWHALGEWITGRVSKRCARRRMAHRAVLRAAIRPASPGPDGCAQWTAADQWMFQRAAIGRGVQPVRGAAA